MSDNANIDQTEQETVSTGEAKPEKHRSPLRTAAEIAFVVLAAALSIVVFIYRDKIGSVSGVGYLGLFLLCFLANATVLLPSPSLMIAASAALIMNPVLVALTAAAGSSLGELVGYACGQVGQDLSPKFKKLLDSMTKKIHKDVLIVFILALLPLPLFDIVGIYSGGTKMNLLKFYAACFIGKFLKILVYTHTYDLLNLGTSLLPGIGR